jgi:hypothetical protein
MNVSQPTRCIQEPTRETRKVKCPQFAAKGYCPLGFRCNRIHWKQVKETPLAEDRQPNEGLQVYKSHGRPIPPPIISTKPSHRQVKSRQYIITQKNGETLVLKATSSISNYWLAGSNFARHRYNTSNLPKSSRHSEDTPVAPMEIG